MKTLKIFILVIMTNLFGSAALKAQENGIEPITSEYRTAIGVRMGGLTSGLTVKQFISHRSALEGIFSFGMHSFIITGLYERHVDIAGAPGLRWMYGIGGHAGFFNNYGSYYYYRRYVYTETTNVVGIDGIFGIDYKFNKIPFNVGLDVKPFADFYYGPFFFLDGALSLRFAF